ncbi:cell envelope integrity protein TolA [Halomonas sp. TD01]|uniref:cell envelope integrity protein TolA n=1 Tax=Halomonas sp. TD01 TaxID=999141 RepID=UPI000214E110|nr:cell envelope integrity protein TolA [Halomonas sp. TD01]EGP18476.1 TonB-like protein [Halomonas sp. TD01]
MAVKPPRDPQDVGYTWPTVLAVAVHLLVVFFSLVSLPSSTAEPDSSSIVQATLVSTETFTDQAQQATEQQAALNSSTEPDEAEPAPEPDTSEQEALQQQAAEAAAREEAEARAEEQARELQEAQAQAEAEAQRREEEAQRLAEQQEVEAQAREDAQREAEAEAQRQREAEAEAQRQREAEAEAQRQREAEAEAQRQREAEAARQRQLEGEAQAAANAQQAQQAANSFINIVRRAVEQAWLIPAGASDTMSATIQVRLGPSGEVLLTTIASSSGDSAFDRSAMQAVEHAAPFSELRDLPAEQQRNLRQFNLRFTPGDVR